MDVEAGLPMPIPRRPAPLWASGYSSPPQRAPWDFSNSEPLSPTEQRPQPRRRLSQWLAEDPDIRMVAEDEERKQRQRLEREATIIVEEEDSARNALSPEAPSSRRGSATDIQPFAPAAAAEQKNSEPAARPKRRESIKVHLQRIKQKAEKVLEEVHDRLVDSGDHPSSGQVAPAVEEPITSPKSEEGITSPVSPPPELVAEPAILEKPGSPTPSQSSRRTISSAELKDKMRMKIRKQAEKVVERTRDSIQLTRRLQRKPTFRQNSEALSPEQLNTDDAQIQRALQFSTVTPEYPLYQYTPAIQWTEATKRVNRKFVQLDVAIGQLVFNYHWLATEEVETKLHQLQIVPRPAIVCTEKRPGILFAIQRNFPRLGIGKNIQQIRSIVGISGSRPDRYKSRVEIQVVVHFNDIIVHRTPPRPLQSDFCVDLAELYNLEIYTPPESITLTILERFNKGEYREIAVVGLPVPDPGMITDDPEIPNLKPSFATDERINGIPMNTSEIDASLLQLSEGRNTTLRRRGRGILDSHRQSSMAYAAMIRKELLDRFRRSDASKSYSDLMTSNVQLLVNIQSAIDLPVRDSGLLQPYVQVSFQDQNGQTGTVNGANPSWQHSLIFPVRRENESSDLKNVMDTVEIAVYDQSVSTLPKDDRIPNAVHEQTTQRFIASVRIPFSTILSRGNIEGQLRLQLPLFLLGYRLTEKPCYIRVLVALNPPVAVPRLRPPRLNGSFEPATVEAQCRQWETVCSSGPERSGRRYVSLVSDTHGRRVLATRFLRPARLPPRWHKSNVKGSVAEALRAAALIPFASDPIMFPGISDVWTSLQQILQLCCGDEEEHGVLLCCWLLALDVEARLVLGTALPEGDKAAFVYVKHPEITCLLNPTDGNMYSLDDGLCPLLSVGTVITPDNIYGNVQPNDHPSQITWDFTKPHLWHPLWLKPQTSTQNLPNENLEYPELPEEVVSELRSTIEREVRVRFDTNRPYGVPQWNLLASRALREILQEFEAGRPPDVSDKLSRLRESFVVSASAVRIPFESLETTVTQVLRLLYHVDASPQVQFAVAVHVEPLFCHIASISIGVAAMTPKN
ncbi:unnamed protein product, partial [Mesorhabditis spiculigera]